MPVRLETLVFTLNGSAQRLGVSSPPSSGEFGTDLRLREISLQPRGTNSNPVYVGTGSDVTSSNYAVRLPAPSGAIPPAPFILGEFEDGSVTLGDFWVIGTADEHLHILIVRHI